MLHKKRKPSTFTSSSGFTDCKRNTTSNNNMLHSKSTYFYRWLPISCSLAFLFGLGIMINPIMDKADETSAATTNILTDSALGTKVDLIMDDVLDSSTTVEPGDISAIVNSFSVKVEGQADYHISVQAAEGYGSELVGRNNKEKIGGVGNNVTPGNFGDNTWGYALIPLSSDTPSDPTAEQTYSTLPAYGTLTAPTYSVVDARDQTDVYYLAFAAKITDYKPADHYETQALLSVVAEAKEIAETWKTIARMQDMTSEICAQAGTNGWPTSKQLIDDRTASGITEQKTYWVSKLKDGKCWMTQNLDLPLVKDTTLKPADTNTISDYTVSNDFSFYQDPGMYVYTGAEKSIPTVNETVISTFSANAEYFQTFSAGIEDNEDAHYLVGDHYPPHIANLGIYNDSDDICPKGWRLPDKSEYAALINGLNQNTIRLAPYYFVLSGYYSSNGYRTIAGRGTYVTSSYGPANDMTLPYRFDIHQSSLAVANGNSDYGTLFSGRSLRCLAK